MTTTSLTTPQLLLEGQAAAPDGPIDLAPMYVMHRAFRRDMALFAAAVPVTPTNDRATWRRLRDRWALFGLILHKHHTVEDDALWPMLHERSGGGDAAAVLDAMAAEHSVIDPLLERVADGLDRLSDADLPAVRDDLGATLDELAAALSLHLGHEERDAMGLVQRHLSQADWDAVDRVFASEYRPAEVPRALGWVVWQLPAEAVRRIPGMNRLMAAAGGFFARRRRASDRRTFRYLGTDNSLLA